MFGYEWPCAKLVTTYLNACSSFLVFVAMLHGLGYVLGYIYKFLSDGFIQFPLLSDSHISYVYISWYPYLIFLGKVVLSRLERPLMWSVAVACLVTGQTKVCGRTCQTVQIHKSDTYCITHTWLSCDCYGYLSIFSIIHITASDFVYIGCCTICVFDLVLCSSSDNSMYRSEKGAGLRFVHWDWAWMSVLFPFNFDKPWSPFLHDCIYFVCQAL